jgi:hypothetical protein
VKGFIVRKPLKTLEAGVGIEPASTALQAAVFLPPRPNIHAAFGQIEAWIHF